MTAQPWSGRVDHIDQPCVFDSRKGPLLSEHQGVPGELVDVLVMQVKVPVGSSPVGFGHQLLHPGGGGWSLDRGENGTQISN